MDSKLELVVSLLTAATVLAVGLEIDIRMIRSLKGQIFRIFGLLAGQMILIPALAVLITTVMPMPEGLKVVVLVLSVCPTGNIANFFTLLAGGNLVLSVLASACSCLMAPVFMPAMLWVFGKLMHQSLAGILPQGLLLIRVFLLTWAPLFVGAVIRNLRISGIAVFSSGLRKASAVGLLALCIFIFVTRFSDLTADLRSNIATSLVLIVAAILGALGVARLMNLPARDAVCYVTTFPARHLGLLAALLAAINRLDGLVFIVIYFASESLIMLTGVFAYRRLATGLGEVGQQ